MQECALYYHSNNVISNLKLAQYCKMNFLVCLGFQKQFLVTPVIFAGCFEFETLSQHFYLPTMYLHPTKIRADILGRKYIRILIFGPHYVRQTSVLYVLRVVSILSHLHLHGIITRVFQIP